MGETTENRLTSLEIGQAKLSEQYTHICTKLDKIIGNEQEHMALLIKTIAVIAVGERLISGLITIAGNM